MGTKPLISFNEKSRQKVFWNKMSLKELWIKGVGHLLGFCYMGFPIMIFLLMLASILYTVSNPIVYVLAIIGALVVFPIAQTFWFEALIYEFKDGEIILDLRMSRKKKRIILV